MLKKTFRSATSVVALAATGALLLQAPALAAEVLVPAGATVGQQALADGDVLNVQAGGTVENAGDAVIVLVDPITFSILNAGVIRSTAQDGIDGQTSILSNLTNSGTIFGLFDGVSADTMTSVTNSGTIQSGGNPALRAQTLVLLNNTGIILGGSDGISANVAIGTVINSGTITGTAHHGIQGNNIGTITNSGSIGGGLFGITAQQNIGSIVNSGQISGTTQAGIRSVGNITSLVNSGTITSNQVGVVTNNVASLINSGTITGNFQGVSSGVGPTVVVNSGTISSTASFALSLGGDVSGQNSGTILSTAGIGFGAGNLSNFTNTGLISGATVGISANNLLSFTNSGTVRAATPAGFAVIEGGGDTTLNLNAGSVLIGRVAIAPGNDTLNVGPGLNLALTFDTSVPETINPGSSILMVDGLTVHVFDPQSIGVGEVLVADLAGGIGDMLGGVLDQGFDERGGHDDVSFWLKGIGGASGRSGNTQVSNVFGGAAFGADFQPSADSHLGFFLGAARALSNAPSGATTVDSFYAGIYGSTELEEVTIEASLTGGHLGAAHTRTIANNTVATGLQTATGNSNGFFVSPEITFARPWTTETTSFETSLMLRYTGAFNSGYTETGIAPALTVGASSAHIVESELLVSLPFQSASEAGMASGDLHAGLEGRGVFNPGGGASSLGALPVALSPASSVFTGGLVAGADLQFKTGALTIYGGADGVIRTDASFGVTGVLGIKGSY